MADRYVEDPIVYRIAYSRIAQLLHLATEAENGDGEKKLDNHVRDVLDKLPGSGPPLSREEAAVTALRESVALIERTRAELVELGWMYVGWTPSRGKRWIRTVKGERLRLAEFLDQVVEPATVVLCFSAEIENLEPGELIEEPILKPKFSPEPLDRRVVDLQDKTFLEEDVDQEWLRSYLGYLAITPPREQRDRPERFGWKAVPDVNYRVRYNLACLYSRIGARQYLARSDELPETFRRAAVQLRLAIGGAELGERQALAAWARRDPALLPLQQSFPQLFSSAVAGPGTSDEVI
jgi:hypothetical protein